ncbi:MAG: hypothetical protein KBF83_06240, partial [Pyrinomonadaceae bacterium]|nr:hypothetical protein [Pyrinomonadaceae bacterium]MBP9109135.1 hypothetical protein [Pyrinomonadaceae bacterium]
MKNRTNTRRCGRTYNVLSAKTLILAGFAVIISLGISSLTLYTRTAAMQELDKSKLTPPTEAALESFESKSFDSPLVDATSGTGSNPFGSGSPHAYEARLVASDPGNLEHFGYDVAISGNTAIVGARRDGFPGDVGAAYIYVRNGTTWSEQTKLIPNNPNRDNFGWSVAIEGDTAVVGAVGAGVAIPGAVHIYTRTGSTWTLQQRIAGGTAFGNDVAISGNTVVVTGSSSTPTAHVYFRTGSTWSEQQTLNASIGLRILAVAISGDTAVLATPFDGPQGSRPGSAFVYIRSGTTWTLEQRLQASDPVDGSGFGTSVAIDDVTIIVGAVGSINAAYVFVRGPVNWTQQKKLSASDAEPNDAFGRSVALLGDTAVVGADLDDFGTATNQGSAYVYTRCGVEWTEMQKLTIPAGGVGVQPRFGYSVTLSADTVLAGAESDDLTSAQLNEGSTYVFRSSGGSFGQPVGTQCTSEIIVNRTSDEEDFSLNDDFCDVDMNTSGNQCTLRAAIQTANDLPGPDTIKFDIPGGGVQTISPAGALPP